MSQNVAGNTVKPGKFFISAGHVATSPPRDRKHFGYGIVGVNSPGAAETVRKHLAVMLPIELVEPCVGSRHRNHSVSQPYMPGNHRERTKNLASLLQRIGCPLEGSSGHTHVEAGQRAGLSAGGLSREGSRHLEPSPIAPAHESDALLQQNLTHRLNRRAPGRP